MLRNSFYSAITDKGVHYSKLKREQLFKKGEASYLKGQRINLCLGEYGFTFQIVTFNILKYSNQPGTVNKLNAALPCLPLEKPMINNIPSQHLGKTKEPHNIFKCILFNSMIKKSCTELS